MRVGQKNKLTYRWARTGPRPRAIHDQRTQSTYLFGAVCPERGAGAALVSLSATPRPCSFILMRLPPRSAPAPTPFSSSTRPAGTAPRTSRCPETSRSCHCRREHLNSTLRKTSGSSCDRTGYRTGSSNPSTISSTTVATPGTPSSISPGKSCPSHAVIGPSSVTQYEDWYKTVPGQAVVIGKRSLFVKLLDN